MIIAILAGFVLNPLIKWVSAKLGNKKLEEKSKIDLDKVPLEDLPPELSGDGDQNKLVNVKELVEALEIKVNETIETNKEQLAEESEIIPKIDVLTAEVRRVHKAIIKLDNELLGDREPRDELKEIRIHINKVAEKIFNQVAEELLNETRLAVKDNISKIPIKELRDEFKLVTKKIDEFIEKNPSHSGFASK